MCKSSSDCAKCQYHGDKCDNVIELLEKTVAEVEKWSQEHPRKTRQDVFLERYPMARVTDGGALGILPCLLDETLFAHCRHVGCDDCRREFWMQEVE